MTATLAALIARRRAHDRYGSARRAPLVGRYAPYLKARSKAAAREGGRARRTGGGLSCSSPMTPSGGGTLPARPPPAVDRLLSDRRRSLTPQQWGPPAVREHSPRADRRRLHRGRAIQSIDRTSSNRSPSRVCSTPRTATCRIGCGGRNGFIKKNDQAIRESTARAEAHTAVSPTRSRDSSSCSWRRCPAAPAAVLARNRGLRGGTRDMNEKNGATRPVRDRRSR